MTPYGHTVPTRMLILERVIYLLAKDKQRSPLNPFPYDVACICPKMCFPVELAFEITLRLHQVCPILSNNAKFYF